MLVKTLSVLGLGFALCSCGVQKPELKPLKNVRKLQAPSYDQNNIESLVTALDEEGKTFVGSLIVWDEKADPSEVSQVINLSNETKKTEAKYKKSLEEGNEDDSNELFGQYMTLKATTIGKLTSDSNLAHSFWANMELKLEKDENDQLKITWTLDPNFETKVFEAHVLDKNKKVNESDKMTCSFDREYGSFKLSFSQEAVAEMGWESEDKIEGEPFFHMIPEGKMENSKVSFELTYIHYQKSVPMFTGKFFIHNDKGVELYQGSVLLTVPSL